MLAQAVTGTPGHINTMARSVRHFLDVFPVVDMKDGDIFPPLDTTFDGVTHWLVDGFHRYHAYKILGIKEPCSISEVRSEQKD